jgi:hypothetical protein
MSKFKNEVKLTDEAWAIAIKTRDPICRFPNCNNPTTDACHIFKRGNMTVRFDLRNGLGGCRECHSHQETHPSESEYIFRRIIGEELYTELEALSLQMTKLFPHDLTKIRKDIRMYTKNLIEQHES